MRGRLLVLCALTASCIDLPEEYRIEDLRIIEVRAEPPEVPIFQDAPIRGPTEDVLRTPLDTRDVRMTVVAAHPDLDATFSYSWIRCKPGLRRVPCDGDEKIRLGSGTSSIAVSPVGLLVDDLVAEGADPVEVFASLAEDPRDLFSGLYANINVTVGVDTASVDVDTTALDARKRIVLFDPAVVGIVLREARSMQVEVPAGITVPELCTNASPAQLETLFGYLEARVPNRSPTFVGIDVEGPDDEAPRRYDPAEGPIVLRPGDTLEMTPVADEADLETFRVIDDGCELVESTETLSWSWFVTAGSISSHITSLGTSDPVDESSTTFTAGPVDGEPQRVRIHSVLRDGRGGSDSARIDVVVRP